MSLELKIESFQQNGVFPLPQCNISLIHSAISIYQHNSASQGPVSAKVQTLTPPASKLHRERYKIQATIYLGLQLHDERKRSKLISSPR